MGEAVRSFEHVDAAVDAQFGEQAATTNCLQLAMVTDQDKAPAVRLSRG